MKMSKQNKRKVWWLVGIAAAAAVLWWIWRQLAPMKSGPVGKAGGNYATPHFAWSELLRGNRDTANAPIAPYAKPPVGEIFDASGALTPLGATLLAWAELLEKVRTAIGNHPITARPVITQSAPVIVAFWSTDGAVCQADLQAAATTVVAGKTVKVGGVDKPIVTGPGAFAGTAADPKSFDAVEAVVWST